MKLAVVCDTHFGARGDSPAMQNSMKKFYENVFFPTLDKHNVSEVLHGGDYMDRRKFVNYQTAQFVHDVYRKPMRERNIQETILLGNHDIYYRNGTEVNCVTELYREATDINIVKSPVEQEFGGCLFLLLPWMCESNRADSMRLIDESKAQFVLGHLELQGFQMYRGQPASYEGLDPKLFDRFDLVMSGHYHHQSQQGPIKYLGAPYPMIWSDYRDARGFHVFDTETHELTFIENPYSLFVRMVYDDKDKKHNYVEQIVKGILTQGSVFSEAYVKIIVKTKEQPYWFDLVVDACYKQNAQDVQVIDDIVINDGEDDSESNVQTLDTLALMQEYVETLTISCDKSELQKYLQELYKKAIDSTLSARLT